MSRKIIKIGSSVGITLPQQTLRKLGLSVGDEVELAEDNDKMVIKKKEKDTKVDQELIDWTDQFIDTYRDALEELADK